MDISVAASAAYYNDLEDPRKSRGQLHLFFDILMISICAIICGADSWVAVETFGKAKAEWFQTILKLPNGIPSHDTYRRLFMPLDKDAFGFCFTNWIQGIEHITSGQVIAIDGKTARASHGESKFTKATHMVSAWATTNGFVLGQVAVPEKTNEIMAIPELLYLLNLTDCLVTIDTLGCQKEIAEQIVDQGGDYLLMAKGNQPFLHEDIAYLFDNGLGTNFKSLDYGYAYQESQGHGRHEKRQWPKLTTIAMVKSERKVGEELQACTRYYISSLDKNLESDATRILIASRNHWQIENKLHWVLDVSFNEDTNRV